MGESSILIYKEYALCVFNLLPDRRFFLLNKYGVVVN